MKKYKKRKKYIKKYKKVSVTNKTKYYFRIKGGICLSCMHCISTKCFDNKTIHIFYFYYIKINTLTNFYCKSISLKIL